MESVIISAGKRLYGYMNNNTKVILGLVLAVLIGFALYYQMREPESVVEENTSVVTVPNIGGCYVATLAKDVYTLKVEDQDGDKVSGRLVFKNFEKDSSAGDFEGTYRDGLLFGNYTFQSEGSTSVLNIIFKKQGMDFIRGYGDMNAAGDTFADINKVTFDSNAVFKAVEDCETSL